VEKSRQDDVASVASLDGLTSVRNAVLSVHRIIEGGLKMGFVVITYKIFPSDIIEDFGPLKKRIESNLPEFATVHGYGEEPVAFGLKALLIQIKFPEDKTGVLDEFEKKIETIEEISQVQTLMVRRTSR
jgi:elongation factor 1-beta